MLQHCKVILSRKNGDLLLLKCVLENTLAVSEEMYCVCSDLPLIYHFRKKFKNYSHLFPFLLYLKWEEIPPSLSPPTSIWVRSWIKINANNKLFSCRFSSRLQQVGFSKHITGIGSWLCKISQWEIQQILGASHISHLARIQKLAEFHCFGKFKVNVRFNFINNSSYCLGNGNSTYV